VDYGSPAGRGRRMASRLRAPATNLWPFLQQTAAATLAWLLAVQLAHHHEPFFAPIAAVVALNTPLGERGYNALRLLLGVLVGIATGEIAIQVLHGGYGTLALAIFVAMALARAIDSTRVVIAQAGAGAILTVATADGRVGPQRLVDALLGAGVALIFSQLLFPPQPLALVHRAEAAALKDMAEGLTLTARALELDDDQLARRALGTLRHLGDRLAEVDRVRRASSRVVRHSIRWRSQKVSLAGENVNAGQLDLLSGSCVLLARTAATARVSQPAALVAGIRGLAILLTDLAAAPGDYAVRQRAAARAAELAAPVIRKLPTAAAAAPAVALRMVTTDIMAFSGVGREEASDIVGSSPAECQEGDQAR
jgi:hypothetical protein